jgi:hypothetical protein
MQTVIARHKVGDIDTWLKGHNDRVELFKQANSTFRTFQDGNDPKSVLLLIETGDLDGLAAMINDTANAAIKAKHTVIEPITISLEVSR